MGQQFLFASDLKRINCLKPLFTDLQPCLDPSLFINFYKILRYSYKEENRWEWGGLWAPGEEEVSQGFEPLQPVPQFWNNRWAKLQICVLTAFQVLLHEQRSEPRWMKTNEEEDKYTEEHSSSFQNKQSSGSCQLRRILWSSFFLVFESCLVSKSLLN